MNIKIPLWCGAISAVIAGPAVAQSVQSNALELSCSGSGSKTVVERSTHTRKDGKNEPFNSTRDRREAIQGVVRFAMTANGPRLRLFPALMPDLNVEGAAEWREIDDFVMNDSVIKGSVSTGFLSNVSFEIDRRNGDIQVIGYNKQFAGNCTREVNDGNFRKF